MKGILNALLLVYLVIQFIIAVVRDTYNEQAHWIVPLVYVAVVALSVVVVSCLLYGTGLLLIWGGEWLIL